MVRLGLEQSKNKREENLVEYGGPGLFIGGNQLDREKGPL